MQLIPCGLLALVSHPRTRHAWINRVFWAFCVYVEAVSVAPQVIMMQRNRTVERFTGHYVFFLGMARFFSCAHWLLQMVDERNAQLWAVRTTLTCCLSLLSALVIPMLGALSLVPTTVSAVLGLCVFSCTVF